MKTIIAGERDYYLTKEDFEFLKTLQITEVISGGTYGVDKEGEIFAEQNKIPLKIFPANWVKYGKAAGHILNEQMADKNAQKYKLKIVDKRFK
jgi:hypothetical protein